MYYSGSSIYIIIYPSIDVHSVREVNSLSTVSFLSICNIMGGRNSYCAYRKTQLDLIQWDLFLGDH